MQLKGAAAEVEACDELMAAELILSGTFNELTPAAAVALCACLIAEQVEKVKPAVPPTSWVRSRRCTRPRTCGAYDAALLDEQEFVARSTAAWSTWPTRGPEASA